MDSKKLIKYFPTVLLISCFLGFSVFFYFTSPDKLVTLIGINNAYTMIFILAFIGGLSTFAGVPYHLVLIALAAGGLNPWLLGTATATGVMLGDTTSYYVGYRGSEILPNRVHDILQRLIKYFMRYPRLLPFFFLFYACFVPLSNDFIVISMGLAKYPFWKVMVPLSIGNLFFNIMLAYLSIYAYGFVQAFFL